MIIERPVMYRDRAKEEDRDDSLFETPSKKMKIHTMSEAASSPTQYYVTMTPTLGRVFQSMNMTEKPKATMRNLFSPSIQNVRKKLWDTLEQAHMLVMHNVAPPMNYSLPMKREPFADLTMEPALRWQMGREHMHPKARLMLGPYITHPDDPFLDKLTYQELDEPHVVLAKRHRELLGTKPDFLRPNIPRGSEADGDGHGDSDDNDSDDWGEPIIQLQDPEQEKLYDLLTFDKEVDENIAPDTVSDINNLLAFHKEVGENIAPDTVSDMNKLLTFDKEVEENIAPKTVSNMNIVDIRPLASPQKKSAHDSPGFRHVSPFKARPVLSPIQIPGSTASFASKTDVHMKAIQKYHSVNANRRRQVGATMEN
ncbi:hypothetical protein HK104_010374 [Borealophlyctis nickersoniae]|nr:hypothetical protein HK104_010374 [Borealophlyctis nickersoniae]